MAANQFAECLVVSLLGAFDQWGVGITDRPFELCGSSTKFQQWTSFIAGLTPSYTAQVQVVPTSACEDGAVPVSRPASPGASRTRRWTAPVIALAAIVALTACKVDATVEFTTDRAGVGAVVVSVTADAEVVQAAPELTADIRVADLQAAGWIVEGPSPQPDGGLSLVLRRPITTPQDATAVLEQLSGPDGPFRNLVVTQQRSFANVTTKVTGAIDVTRGLSGLIDANVAQLLGGEPYAQTLLDRNLTLDQVFGLRFVATTPGVVQTTDGVTSPTTGAGLDLLSMVEWRAIIPASGPRPINLESALRDLGAQNARRWRDFTPWAAAAWVVFFLGVVLPLVHLVTRSRRRREL